MGRATGQALAAGGLLNPGFEEYDTAGRALHWSPLGPESAPRTSSSGARAHSGERALCIDDDAATSVGARSTRVDVAEGTVYEAEVQLLIESGRFAIYLEFWNTAGKRVASHFRESTYGDDWHRLTVRATAPADAVHATVLLYSATSNRGVAYFDDVALATIVPAPVEQFGPAAHTAAVRGVTLLGDRLFVSSASTVDGNLRLAEVDPWAREVVATVDLDLGGAAGACLASDDSHVYLGVAGSTHLWRYDPEAREATAWAQLSETSLTIKDLQVVDDHVLVSSYPDGMVRRVRLRDARVSVYGRVSDSLSASAVAGDARYVYGASGAPGTVLRWRNDGSEPVDLSRRLSDSTLGVRCLVGSGDRVVVATTGQVTTMRPDGTGRVVHPLPDGDRVVDRLTVAPDGSVHALAGPTGNLYRVDDEALVPLGRPHAAPLHVGLEAAPAGGLVGVSATGDVWTWDEEAGTSMFRLIETDFACPDAARSMWLDPARQRLWVAGDHSMTVHDTASGHRETFHAPGRARALVGASDGTAYAAMDSGGIVAFHPAQDDPSEIGRLDPGSVPLDMHYDGARSQLLVAVGSPDDESAGALTFIDLATGHFDTQRDVLPNQSITGIAVSGSTAYVVGDVRGGSPGSDGQAAEVGAVDLHSRTLLWRAVLDPALRAYQAVIIEGGLLYLMGRRPNGHWFSYDLTRREIVQSGYLGGYGAFGQSRGHVFSWTRWDGEIRELPSAESTREQVLHAAVPMGWANDPKFCFTPNGKDIWGLHGTNLARFPLIS